MENQEWATLYFAFARWQDNDDEHSYNFAHWVCCLFDYRELCTFCCHNAGGKHNAILSSFEALGIIFFYGTVFLIQLKNYKAKNIRQIIWFLFIVHLMMLALTYQRGILKMFIHFLTSVFILSLFMWFIQILKNEFSCFKPIEVTSNPLLSEVAPDSKIHLADYGLSDRQINMLMDYMKTNASYRLLSEKYYISTSTVKKDFAEILKIFHVSRVEHLHILLIQYEIER